jgi:hypothetical protein
MKSLDRRIVFTVLVLMLSACLSLSARAQDEEDADTPPFIPIVEFGTYGSAFTPSQATLSADEEKAFHDYVKALPPFPRYLVGGPQDRAHAAYMMMPASLKDKVSKIWIISPSKHSASVKGVIKPSPTVPDSLDVKWSYHVALTYKNADGLQVYDPGMGPGKVLLAGDWFAYLKLPPLTFWTLTAGRIYIFNSTNAPNSSNKDIWGGNAHEYTGDSVTQQLIPVALARDAVGEAILKNRKCEILKPEAKDPEALLERMKKANVPEGCEELLELFKAQKQLWIDKLR